MIEASMLNENKESVPEGYENFNEANRRALKGFEENMPTLDTNPIELRNKIKAAFVREYQSLTKDELITFVADRNTSLTTDALTKWVIHHELKNLGLCP